MLIGAWSVDLGTVGLLAGLLWLDGWRRAPDDALLVARVGTGPWTVRVPWARVGRFVLVGFWPPIVLPLLLAPITASDASRDHTTWAADFQVAVARGRRRIRRVRVQTGVLRALGVLMVMSMIIGIPLAVSRFGGAGLVLSIAGVLLLAAGMAALAACALGTLGTPLGSAIVRVLAFVSPFSAPRATELVTATALTGLGPAASLAVLLGEPRFLAWARPWVYDGLHGRAGGAGHDAVREASLLRALPRDVLQRAMHRVPNPTIGHRGGRYCPRCACSYRDGAVACFDCDGVALVPYGP